jgi:hypothetical protein
MKPGAASTSTLPPKRMHLGPVQQASFAHIFQEIRLYSNQGGTNVPCVGQLLLLKQPIVLRDALRRAAC